MKIYRTIYLYNRSRLFSSFRETKNACAICKQAFTEELKPRIDHDHTTKKVREVLCHHCNVALGHFKDDINILKTTIKYLEDGGK